MGGLAIIEKFGTGDPLVSVCIPTVNLARLSTAKMALAEACAGLPVELVYSRDTHGEGAPKVLKRLVEQSSGQYICFIGEDTIPMPGFIHEALSAMASLPGGVGLVGLSEDLPGREMISTLSTTSLRLQILFGWAPRLVTGATRETVPSKLATTFHRLILPGIREGRAIA